MVIEVLVISSAIDFAVQAFDKDKDGTVSFEELHQAFKGTGPAA